MAPRNLLLLSTLLITHSFCLAQTGVNTHWNWMHGDYMVNHPGIYTYQPQNPFLMPGARAMSASWTRGSNELWLYGGSGYDGAGAVGYLADLWKFSGSLWVFVKGSPVKDVAASYSALGVPANSNTPGARSGCISWKDNNGNLWLFGGVAPSPTAWQFQNDLWKYDPLINQWTWMHGDNISNQVGVYGTQGVSSPANKPGARSNGTTWVDNSGQFWLFGGNGPDEALFNDLWKFNPQTNEWTWMKGDQVIFQAGVYGAQGVSSPSNKPGSRVGGANWIDANGKLWLYGGSGYAENLFWGGGTLSDLWKYDPLTNEWTWMHGNKTLNNIAVYGTQGIADIANMPGARNASYAWLDAFGQLWMYGGWGYGSNATYTGGFNDLWKYNPLSNQWTWMQGNQVPDQAGNYNVGAVPGFINKPGSRYGGESWTTNTSFWMFGGYGSAITPTTGYLNDLWSISSADLAILPVSITSFGGELRGKNVCLYWQSAQEENFSHYIIQRSVDGNRYSDLSTVSRPAEQVGNLKSYTYVDVNATEAMRGKLFYRLNMVDRDGSSSFSRVVVITAGMNGTKMYAYPNVTSGAFNLVIEDARDAQAQLLVLNSSGMEVEERMLRLAKGRNVFAMDISRYRAGIYILRLRASTGIIETRIIKQ